MIVIMMSLDSSIDEPRKRGYFSVIRNRYEMFARFDNVTLLTQDTQDFTDSFAGVEHIPCAKRLGVFLSRLTYLRWFFFFLFSFIWLIKHRKVINIVISEGIDSPAPFIFSMLFSIPYVIRYHYDVAYQVRNINRRLVTGILLLGLEHLAFSRVCSVWVVSPSLVAKAKAFGARRTAIIPNWEEIKEGQIRTTSKKGSTGFRILFVGRLHRVKQVDLLIRAFYHLHEANPSVHMDIVGDGEERQNLMALTHDLGLSNSVHFLGFVKRRTIFEMMKQSNVLVLPSKVEGNPRVLIEAMMNKVPVVATNVPGIRDMVHHMKTGYLVAHADALELARGIEYVLKNKQYAAKMTERAYTFAKQNFSKESVSQKILDELALLVPKYRARVASQKEPITEKCSLSVIIPAFNAERTIGRCLSSVVNEMRNVPNKEIIVVDDASTDNTFEIASEFSVKLVRNIKRYGSSVARNKGLKLAKGEFIAFVDSDVIVEKGSFEKMLSVLIENQVGGVTGVTEPLSSNLVSDSLKVRLFGWSCMDTRVRETDSVGTGFALHPRKLLMELRGFNTNFFHGGEDYDLNLRIKKAGYKLLVVPSARAYHDHPTTLGKMALKWFKYGSSFFKVSETHRLKKSTILILGWPIGCTLLLLLFFVTKRLLFLPLFIFTFWLPWALYYGNETIKLLVNTKRIKYLALPLIHQIIILSHTSGFLYSLLKALLRPKHSRTHD